jgi:hypothetical protein
MTRDRNNGAHQAAWCPRPAPAPRDRATFHRTREALTTVTRPTWHMRGDTCATRYASRAIRRVHRRILRQRVEDSAVSEHPATSPTRALLEDAFGSFGKVVAAVAGAGIFLYLIGVAVLWLRLAAAGLQQQEVVAAIPRDQLAVLGAREALLSTISGLLFALLLYAFFRVFRVSQQLLTTKGVRGVLARWMRERPALMFTVIIGGWCVLFVPLDTPGTLFLILFLANIYFGFRSAHRSLIGELPDFRTSVRPWLRVGLGLAIAVFLVSIARQSEFPDGFSRAMVSLKGEDTIFGQYLGSTSDSIIIGQPPRSGHETCGAAPRQAAAAAATCMLSRDDIKDIRLTNGSRPSGPGSSLLRRLGLVELECLAPVCRWHKDIYSWLQPFVTDN